MGPISVTAYRGSFAESFHHVHAVAVHDGEIVAQAGDAAFPASLRSAAKPFQALPLVRAREDLPDDLLAIAAASHRAEPEQIDAVRRLLAAGGSREDELECGLQEGRPPEPLYHNCSGKHAGMLATCRARGWQPKGYRRSDHPLQRELLEDVAAAAEVDARTIPTGTDGCGVVCFSLPLERVAFMFSRLEQREGGARVAAAMRTHPRLVGGAGQADTDLMEALPGSIAKGGAEGLLGASDADGVGLALKVADGNFRALRPAVGELLRRLGHELDAFADVPLRNSRGEEIGRLGTSEKICSSLRPSGVTSPTARGEPGDGGTGSRRV
jgi:L-asparaginase II